MANKKISELPSADEPLNDADLVEIVQGGINKKAPKSAFGGGGSGTVESVTGDGVDNTDPDNPVLSFPTAADIGLGNVNNVATVGIEDLFFPADSFGPRFTNGCDPAEAFEMATSLANVVGLPFDQTTQEFAQVRIVPPRKWNGGTITVVPYWIATSGSGTVRWAFNGGMYRNDDPLTVAFGTAQNSDDTLTAVNDLCIGPETSAITLSGTHADGVYVLLQVARDPSNDTLNADAIFLGASVRFTTDAAIDG